MATWNHKLIYFKWLFINGDKHEFLYWFLFVWKNEFN